MPRHGMILALAASLPAPILSTAASAREAPASLRSFETALAAQPSATAALTEWCAARHIAEPAAITAERLAGESPYRMDAVRKLLQVGPTQPVMQRNVRLKCGETALSIAYNWYIPSRLTPEMNQALETTQTPFGMVAAPLNFTRESLVRAKGAVHGCPKDSVLSHVARLKSADGQLISLVIECYTAANLSAGGE